MRNAMKKRGKIEESRAEEAEENVKM